MQVLRKHSVQPLQLDWINVQSASGGTLQGPARTCAVNAPGERAHTVMPNPPMIVGCHKRRLDASRRLRLPVHWLIAGNQTWLLFPRHIVPPWKQDTRPLYLKPVNDSVIREILSSSPSHVACAPTVETVHDVLCIHAQRLALDPSVASVIRTTPNSRRITLTKAQVTWLGCRGRTLIVVGSLIAARIFSQPAWAREQRRMRSAIS